MIRTFSFSAAGGHAVNEDAFVLRPLWREPDCWLVCVADGQGGRAGGAAAAQLACRSASETMGDSLSTPWNEIVSQADAAVAADPAAGLTTLVALTVDETGPVVVSGMSCGDSAVLAVSGAGGVEELTAHQFKNPPVGSGGATFVPFLLELAVPWKVLAMTDGVWKYAGWPKIRELAVQLSGEELIAQLRNAARLLSGEFQDDFTVVLLESE